MQKHSESIFIKYPVDIMSDIEKNYKYIFSRTRDWLNKLYRKYYNVLGVKIQKAPAREYYDEYN